MVTRLRRRLYVELCYLQHGGRKRWNPIRHKERFIKRLRARWEKLRKKRQPLLRYIPTVIDRHLADVTGETGQTILTGACLPVALPLTQYPGTC